VRTPKSPRTRRDVERLCLICHRIQDDPIHDVRRSQRIVEIVPRIEFHRFDPGERRRFVRRESDREHNS
jgi:hypothetical protein